MATVTTPYSPDYVNSYNGSELGSALGYGTPIGPSAPGTTGLAGQGVISPYSTAPNPYHDDGSGTNAALLNGGATGPSISSINDSAINSGIDRLGLQSSVGNQNILNSYQTAFDRLTGQKAADLSGYDNQRLQSQNDNQTARDNIGAGVRNVNTGLLRLLGIHGSGSSSAASILAPFAAAQQGNQQRSQVQQAYGQNMNALDQAIANTNTGYDNAFGQLLTDRTQQQNNLQSGIETQRANLLGQRSDSVNNQSVIQGILDNIVKLGLNPTFTPAPVQVAKPDLAKYNYAPTAAPQLGGNPGVSDSALAATGPFYSLLAGQKKQLAGA